MAKEIRVPALGESVTEATIAKWFKKEGEAVKVDEPLVELETDKVTVEVPAPASGKLASIAAAAGTTVNVGALLGAIEEGAAGAAAKPAAAAPVPHLLPQKIAEPAKGGSATVARRAQDGRGKQARPCRPFRAPARMAASPRAM